MVSFFLAHSISIYHSLKQQTRAVTYRIWRVAKLTHLPHQIIYIILCIIFLRVHVFACMCMCVCVHTSYINQPLQILATKSTENINNLNNEGYTPLHLSCQWDKPDCVKALLAAGADANIQSAKSRGPSNNNSKYTTQHMCFFD